jgi:serine/threonine-protein kinase SRPK3
LSHLSEEELFEVLGLPESEELVRLDGESLGESVPNQLVKSVEWVGWPDEDDEDDEDIRIIDLGEAFVQDAVPERLAQPGGLQVPETIFTSKFDYRLDLWRAGLIVRFPPPTLCERLTDICCRSIISRSEHFHSNGLKSTPWLHR